MNECQLGFYPLFCEGEDWNNELECFQEAPQGYYFDSSDKMFKKCFISCYDCNWQGSEIDNNCITCKNNFTFLKDFVNNNNCYEKCKYYCTKNLKCPENIIN